MDHVQTTAKTLPIKAFAERVGVKHGTLRRWMTEGMPGVLRGPTGKAKAIIIDEADAWCATKRVGRSWAFGRSTLVYFVRCRKTGEIKIGFSQNVTGRVTEIHRKERRVVDVLATLPGDKHTEGALHRAFAECRIGESEWFLPSNDLVSFVERVAKGRAA